MILKEKASNEASAKGLIEPFFFAQNDGRFAEAGQYLLLKESLNKLRTKYEEKRPLIASMMKKKNEKQVVKARKNTF